jgi:type IV pilus assembly protein PilM
MIGSKSNHILGLDIGTFTVKGVLLEHLKQGYRVIGAHQVPLYTRVESYDPTKLSSVDSLTAIKQLISKFNIKPQRANLVSALGGAATSLKEIKSIQMTDEELNTSLNFEARKHLPIDEGDTIIDFQVLGDDPQNPEQLRILLAAGSKKLYSFHQEMLTEAGFKIGAVSLESLAMVNAYFGLEDYPEEGVIVFLNFGARQTTVVVDGRQDRIFSRDIPIGGHHFTNDLAKRRDIKYAAAEALKLDEGIAAFQGASPEEGGALAIQEKTKLDELVEEISRTLRYYIKDTGQNQFNLVVISGGGANLKGFNDHLNEKMNLPVEIYNPFRALEGADKVDLNPADMVVSVGLAMRSE